MIRVDRSRRGPDIWLGEKMIFFAIGAALGIGGMVTGHEWLVWAAIAVLVLGFVLRLMGRRGGDDDAAREAPGDAQGEGHEAHSDADGTPPENGDVDERREGTSS
jgi:hypothetical protein